MEITRKGQSSTVNVSCLNRLLKKGFCITDYALDGVPELCEMAGVLGDAVIGSLSEHPVKHDTLDGLKPILRFHYNDENTYKVITSLNSIKMDKIGVGSFLLVVNSVGEDVSLGLFRGEKVVLRPNQVAIFNVGLSGIEFQLETDGLLKYLVYSEISGVEPEIACGDSSFSQSTFSKMSVCANGLFHDAVDLERWIEDGVVTARLMPDVANALLESLQREEFQSVNSAGGGDKDYGNRFIAKQSLFKPRELRRDHLEVVNKLRDAFSEVLSNKPNPSGDNVSLFEAPIGHYMESHSDCGDASPIIILFYLRDTPWVESDGGCIVSKKMMFDDLGRRVVDDSEEPIRVSPEHGQVVIVNNTSALFTHQVEEVLSGVRYSFIFNLSMLTNPSWDVEYEGKDFGELEMNDFMEDAKSASS